MNILLLNPKFPDTFRSFKHALAFVGKRSAFPPLGLLTVAAMLPGDWNRRLVDLNIESLRRSDLDWADMVFIGGMTIQKASAVELIARCRGAGRTIVAGGPLFTMEPEAFQDVDHLILNEAEVSLPPFLTDLAAGTPRRIYTADRFPSMAESPIPQWDLVKFNRYHAMNIQYSRGCPFNCDFCNITSLLGHGVRTKSTEQILAELDGLYDGGWRGRIFFVDDNFIGNTKRLKTDLLPALIAWRQNKPGITFQTEASINLADDPVLMERMSAAGFQAVFVGIETPDETCLAECGKRQNRNRDLVGDVKRILRAGLQVQAGFIVGFDHDAPSVFRRQIEFIQRSGIVMAMVGILQAPRGTRLYQRMHDEGRLVGTASGDNVEGSTNILPRMDLETLRRGYHEILNTIYEPRHFYTRVKTMLREYTLPKTASLPSRADMRAFVHSIFRLGILGRERFEYWNLVIWTAVHRPSLMPLAVTMAISGYHFRKVCELHVR